MWVGPNPPLGLRKETLPWSDVGVVAAWHGPLCIFSLSLPTAHGQATPPGLLTPAGVLHVANKQPSALFAGSWAHWGPTRTPTELGPTQANPGSCTKGSISATQHSSTSTVACEFLRSASTAPVTHTSAPSATVPLPHHANIHLLLYTHMTSKHTLHATRTSFTKHSIRQITTHSIAPTAATTHDTHAASTGIGHRHRCLYHIMQGGWVVFREVSREICGCSDGSFFTECGLTRAISRHGRKTRLGGCHLQPPSTISHAGYGPQSAFLSWATR